MSAVSLEVKKANIQSLKEKLKSLKNQLTYLTIKAPFDGEIDTIFLHEGDLAVMGKPIISMSDYSQKLIFSYAPTQKITIKKSQKVFYENQEIGEINSIYNTSKNGLVTAEVKLFKEIDKPFGSSINIDVLIASEKGCILPDSTILHKEDSNYVLAFEDGKFVPMKVDITLQNKNFVAISPCPKVPVATANETKLSALPAYNNIKVVGVKDE